jgi:exo-beta-1,3-glucanase (GH17 family)
MIRRLIGVAVLIGLCCVGLVQAQDEPPIIGVNYDVFQPGNPATFPSESEIDRDLELIAEKFTTIRIPDAQTLSEQIINAARAHEVDVVVQARLSGDAAANEAEIAAATALANQYPNVTAVIVGSEVLRRGDLTIDELRAYIEQVRAAVPPQVRVGYSDVFLQWIQNAALTEAVDWVGLNTYGFLNCEEPEAAVRYSVNQWALLLSNPAFQNVPIVITETGWPSDGTLTACPNLTTNQAAQARFIAALVNNARAAHIDLFIYSFADAPWLCATDVTLRYRCHWGLVTANRDVKPAWAELPTALRAGELVPILAQVESDNRGSVNCRERPGLEHTVTLLIDNGETVEILDRTSEEEWVRVRTGETTCWVHHSLLLVDGRPVPVASQTLDYRATTLARFIDLADPTLCEGTTPGQLANATWSAADVVSTAACVRNIQVWLPDALRQRDSLIASAVCEIQPIAEQTAVQQRFQNIWALDNIAIAYLNLGRSLRRAGQFQLAYEAFSQIVDEFSCAWAYDASSSDSPYFWSVAQQAAEELASLPLVTGETAP